MTSQRDEFRADGLNQPPTLRPLEQTNDADDRQIQAERQTPRRAVIEDDLCGKLQSEGDDLGFARAEGSLLNLDVKRKNRSPNDKSVRLTDRSRCLHEHCRRNDDLAEDFGQDRQATDLCERDEGTGVKDSDPDPH